MLLIGSHALIHNVGDIGRSPADVDVIGTFDELQGLTRVLRRSGGVTSVPLRDNKTVLHCEDGRIVEFEIAWAGTPAAELLSSGERPWMSFAPLQGLTVSVATLDELYTYKMSHRYLKNSPHFRKTRNDIMFMRRLGAKITDPDWLRRREKETYTYKHPSLNTRKGDFFKGDGVQYVYDHDDIHKAMAHLKEYCVAGPFDDGLITGWYPLPAYRLYMKDGAEVQCDKAKFFSADEEVRLYGVLEEAEVLALERSQIPFRGKVDPRRSFDIALMKVCTSITSGWFREYAWENMDRVEAMYEPDYVDRFWKAVEAGEVRKLEPGEIPSY